MRRGTDPILVVLLALSLCGNVYLFRHQPVVREPIAPLKTGDKVPQFTAKRLGGGRFVGPSGNRPVILYAFSPSCSWCERNLNNAREVARQTEGRYEFVAVALNENGLEEYVRQRSLGDWLVVRDLSDDTRRGYHFGGTPETIVVGLGGSVVNAWFGAYTKNVAKSIEETLGVKLPGLVPLEVAAAPGS